jgi:hypothetical protein
MRAVPPQVVEERLGEGVGRVMGTLRSMLVLLWHRGLHLYKGMP